VHALDAKERECAELSAALETGGDRLAAGVRESKIVEMARKNRSLTLAVEKEKAEKARLVTELKAARAGTAGRAPGVLHAGVSNEDGTPRTESQIEKACREVVAEAAKAAEDASKERAEWKEKAREASARAERDAGRYHTVRAENDRLRLIIKREVGDDKVDFTKLEKSLEAAGGWRGRAREIATLRHKVQRLRDRLELYEDGEQLSVTSTASRFATTGPFGDLPDADLNEGGFEPGSRPGTAATDVSRRTARSFAGASRETAREAAARRRQLEEATAALAASEAACEDARAKAKAAGVRKDALERDVRSLREKLDVLKEKSKHDDRLIDALRADNRRARGEAEEALLRETMTSADFRSAGGAGSSRQRGGVAGFQNFAGGSVPVSVYKALERRAEHADAQLRESEQRVLQLRAKIASLENDAAERPKATERSVIRLARRSPPPPRTLLTTLICRMYRSSTRTTSRRSSSTPRRWSARRKGSGGDSPSPRRRSGRFARGWARRNTRRASSRPGSRRVLVLVLLRRVQYQRRVRAMRGRRTRLTTKTSRRSARAWRRRRLSSSACGAPAANRSSPWRRRWSCTSRWRRR
jgi:hypothetical protein